MSETVDILQGQASLRGIKINFKTESSEAWLMLDAMRIQQILLNLLSNAIKFSNSDDCVNLILSTKDFDQKDIEVSISVQDYGIGICEED